MQSLNDDMDKLFSQAAERYPLKTNSDNWDSVLNKMGEASRQTSYSENRYKKCYGC